MPDMVEYAHELTEALSFAKKGPQCRKSEEAVMLWADAYPTLTNERPGLWGAATARAEAQVIRLSMIYALLDCTDIIRPEHLKAALAVWGYCENSAKFVFSGQAYDPVTDKIMKLLEIGPKTQTEINNSFGGHVTGDELRKKLEALSASGRIVCAEIKMGSRPRKEWSLVAK